LRFRNRFRIWELRFFRFSVQGVRFGVLSYIGFTVVSARVR
jgi:hypothetical protein